MMSSLILSQSNGEEWVKYFFEMMRKILCLSLFKFISLKFVKYLFQVASIYIIFINVFRFRGALPRKLLGGGRY